MQDAKEMKTLAKRALAHFEAGTTDQSPDLMRIPIGAYCDPGEFEQEYKAIFMKKPLGLGLSLEIAEPGSYVAKTMLGTQLLFTRDKDGDAHVFLNVCRHRGAAVCKNGRGKASRFSCPYHAWTYDNTGELVGIYGKSTFGADDTSELGLVELPSAERAGIIWGALTPGADFDIDAWLGDFEQELETLELGNWYLYDQRELPGPGWKITMDGYLEIYHHEVVHADTLAAHTKGNLLVHDTYGPHQRLTLARPNIRDLNDIAEEEWNAIEYLRLIHSIFPNMSVSGILGDHCLVSQILPGDNPEETVTIQTILAAKKPETDEEIARTEAFSEMAKYAVAQEDYVIGGSIQDGIHSGANDVFLIGRNEPAIQHYHRMVADMAKAS